MKKIKIIVILVCLCLSTIGLKAQTQIDIFKQGTKIYHNYSYEFSIRVPSVMQENTFEPYELGLTTDHGSVFTYDDIEFHIYTGYIMNEDETIADVFNEDYSNKDVKYKKLGKTYFVVSGMYDDNTIYYEKRVWLKDVMPSIEVSLKLYYPKHKQNQVESFITYISKWNKKNVN